MEPLKQAFASHPRRWREFRYVYPVIARRSRGLSLGINLNPDGRCSFDCVYCCVDRTGPMPPPDIDLAQLDAELRALAGNWTGLLQEPEFVAIPAEFRRLNDFALSGDGEPTLVSEFPETVARMAAVRTELNLSDTKLVLITNAANLHRPAVAAALSILDQNNGEIWAKLDAGTEEYFRRIDRAAVPFGRVLENLCAAGRVRPVVIQSMFLRLDGEPPAAREIEAYAGRLGDLLAAGARIKLVQVYTVARPTAESTVTALTAAELEIIAARVRALGIPAETYA